MPRIHVLDKHTAELIAAGEVVERPASVVKELMENAIDAGATALTVEIEQGGITLMRFTDNGCGMSREDVPLAFVRHATSKVRSEADLEGIRTLGFRGEALASVASVARVEVVTCARGEDVGTHYGIEGGVECVCDDIGCAQGTVITVRDLFYNVPARMKFLKKDVTEGNAVAGVVERVALSHPEVSVRFLRDGREDILTPGDGTLRSCIYALMGKSFFDGLVPVEYAVDGVGVTGFVSRPSSARGNRSQQHFFINGRYVKTRTAAAALERAYQGMLMGGKFPACILHLTLPHEAVDVNVHPAKIEVRFINEHPVFDAVYHGVRSALEAGDTPKQVRIPTPVTPPRPVPEQQHFAVGRTAAARIDTVAHRPEAPDAAARPAPLQAVSRPSDTVNTVDDTPLPIPPQSTFGGIDGMRAAGGDGLTAFLHSTVCRPAPDIVPDSPAELPSAAVPAAQPPAVKAEETAAEEAAPEAPPVRFCGEVFGTYIVAEQGDSLWVIDKHAAHERILYNKLRAAARDDAQILLQPVTVVLGREEYAAALSALDVLRQAGFDAEDFGGHTLIVRSVPMLLAGCDVAAVIQEICGGFLEGRREAAVAKLEWIYHSAACRAAVKAGDISRPAELQALAEQVLGSDDIRYCPHGRPVCFELTRRELEKQFGRIV